MAILMVVMVVMFCLRKKMLFHKGCNFYFFGNTEWRTIIFVHHNLGELSDDSDQDNRSQIAYLDLNHPRAPHLKYLL